MSDNVTEQNKIYRQLKAEFLDIFKSTSHMLSDSQKYEVSENMDFGEVLLATEFLFDFLGENNAILDDDIKKRLSSLLVKMRSNRC